jgi:lipoprotein signal peptidase
MKVIKKIQAIKYCVVLTIFLVVVDQITKTIAQYTNCNVQLFAGFGLKYVENKGLAFGLLSRSFIGLMGMIIFLPAIFLIYRRYFFVRNSISYGAILALILLLSGAIGSIIDSAVFGFGRDFIRIPYYATINFSDVYTVVGVVLFLVEFFSLNRRRALNDSM